MERMLRDLPLFVEVARQKSFTRAAENLDLPLSTVSRRIIALESELGVRLFLRSSRKVELTEMGVQFFDRCSTVVADAEAAWEELSHNMQGPSGKVRLSLPMDLYLNLCRENCAALRPSGRTSN